jgi:hypothetical protein
MSEISKLSSSQVARLDEFRAKWFSIALSTDPADRSLAEAGVKQAYAAANLSRPKILFWGRSPLAGLLAAALCEVWTVKPVVAGSRVAEMLNEKIWGSVELKVGNRLLRRVNDQVWNKVIDQARAEVRGVLAGSVWSQVWAELGELIESDIRPHVTGLVEDQLSDSMFDTRFLHDVCDPAEGRI